MASELVRLLDVTSPDAARLDYRRAIIEDNVLGKQTLSARRLTDQRLGELYGLDPSVVLFRVLRSLWAVEPGGRPLLACLCGNARDPLLRITSSAVLPAPEGAPVGAADIAEVVADATGSRFKADTINKIARNAASSWTQSGHLAGRVRKVRTKAKATPAATAYALLLGYLCGVRGALLFDTYWVRVLDAGAEEVDALAFEASRRGWIDYRRAGSVAEIGFSGLLTAEDMEAIREQG